MGTCKICGHPRESHDEISGCLRGPVADGYICRCKEFVEGEQINSMPLKEKLRERLLAKNASRSSHFLELKFEEICEVIDDFFDSKHGN